MLKVYNAGSINDVRTLLIKKSNTAKTVPKYSEILKSIKMLARLPAINEIFARSFQIPIKMLALTCSDVSRISQRRGR